MPFYLQKKRKRKTQYVTKSAMRKYLQAMNDVPGARGSDANIELFGAEKYDWRTNQWATDKQLASRKVAGYSGRGDYCGGMPGKNSRAMVGRGDYGPPGANQLIGGPAGPVSVNRTSKSGDIYIEHTEFVQNVYASTTGSVTTFQITAFPINPGMVTTFPFLSQLAQNYVQYDLVGLIFQYKPLSGEYGNTTSNQLGKVIMATQYNPTEAAFVNSVQMENYDYANSGKPSIAMVHGVETALSQRIGGDMLDVRTGSVTTDLRFTDIGTFYIATEGIPINDATEVIGELWVTYKCRLSRANLYGSLLGANIGTDYFTFTNTSAKLMAVATQKSTNTIGTVLANVSSTAFTITWPVDVVLASYVIVIGLNDANELAQTWHALTNGVNISTWLPMADLASTTGYYSINAPSTSDGTTTQLLTAFYVVVNAPGNLQGQIQVNLSAAVASTTAGAITISQVDYLPSLTLT